MTRRQTTLVAVLLFLLAVLLRLPRLGAFLTPDEQRIWTTLTAEFMSALLRGDWAATSTSGYPGVTTTWAGSLGLALQWLVARPSDVTSLAGVPDALLATPSRLDMLPWARFGVILTSSAGIALIFLLTRRLFDDAVALFAAGLLLFDPFLLAHTRILNTDPLLALALTISWLALMIGAADSSRRYLALSGIGFGLALLTKTPALLMTPLVIGWILWRQGHRQSSAVDVLRAGLIDLAWVALPALLTCLVLWPALWVAPLATLQRSIEFAAVLGQTGHELGNFWLSQPVEGPGAMFYPAVLLWRSTPVTLIGLVLAIFALATAALGRLRPTASKNGPEGRSAAWSLVVFVVWFAVAMSFSPKKFDRYLLPAFPAVDILAAWGWLTAVRWISAAGRRRMAAWQPTRGPRFGGNPQPAQSPVSRSPKRVIVAVAVLIGVQATMAISHLPTYLTAYNPLLGGLRTAQRVMLVGWGEGLEDAAAYLDQQPDASSQRAAAWYGSNVFGPFFRGRSFDLHYDLRTAADLYANDIDYVVTYINQLQRHLLDVSVTDRLDTLLMASSWSGVPLAQVYAWPKPFDHTSDRALTDGLHLLGWELGQIATNQSQLPVRLYWDADVAAAGGLTPVLVWLKDASGEVWAKTEVIPTLDPALLTSGWADRQAVLQALTLELPVGLLAGDYRVEMAPQATSSLDLGSVAIPATPYDQTALGDVQAPPQPVVFGDSVQLVGSDLVIENNTWQLDLLWAALALPPKAKFFVHAIDSAGEIVAQVDSVLAALPGQEIAGWQQGELVRQRIRIEWPTDTGEHRSLYLGIYDPDTGQRMPVTAGGQILPDGRYPLMQRDWTFLRRKVQSGFILAEDWTFPGRKVQSGELGVLHAAF